MLLASQAVFYNVIFGLLEGWLTFNWKGGSVSIGKVAHFHFGKVAHFREEIPPMVYDTAKQLSKITGLKVVVSNINPKSMISSIGFEKHLDAGPWEFLNLVKNAEYVVGRSFHLLVFSILLKKKFIAVEGMGDSRLNNLLSLTCLQKYAPVNGNIEEVLANHSYLENDYKVAFDRINIAYDAARQYLLNNLKLQV